MPSHSINYAPFEQDPRNNFMPPRYFINRLTGDTDDAWQAVAPVPLLIDFHGEEAPPHQADIRLACDDAFLYLNARITDAQPLVLPDEPPEGSRFWTQDHVELRLLTNVDDQHDQYQFIAASSGKLFSNKGLAESGDATLDGGVIDGGWRVRMRVFLAALGLNEPRPGLTVRGLVCFSKWNGACPDFACSTACELGFSQAERFGEFVFECNPDSVQLRKLTPPRRLLQQGANSFAVQLHNLSDAPVPGRLIVERQKTAAGAGIQQLHKLTLQPGVNEVIVPVELERPQFNRYVFRFEYGGFARELGAVSLRAAVPDVDASKLNLQHPYLMFTLQRQAELRRKASNPAFEPLIGPLKTLLESDLDAQPPADDTDAGRSSRKFHGTGKAFELAVKFVFTQDTRLPGVATQWIRSTLDSAEMSKYTDLHPGMVSGLLAIAYDTFAPHLDEVERAHWLKLCDAYLQMHLNTARERHWNCTTIANANSVCNGGGGLLALAILCEHPDAVESIQLARKLIRQYIEYSHGPDGGCTEGVQYWEYGGTNYARFAHALENTLGTDDALLAHPHFRRCMNNIRASLCNDGKLHGINDTIPMPVGSELAYFLAGRFNDALGLWYGDKAQQVFLDMIARGKEVAYHSSNIFAAIYRPDVPVSREQPPLPVAFKLDDIQVAILRSSPNYDCVLDAGLKGSRPPYTHHNQPDTGAYFIDVRGERLLIDPGYYKEKPTDHSLPIIDGAAPMQPESFTGRIIECSAFDDIRYAACDSTKAYGGAAKRVIRHLVVVGESAVVLLDDIVAREGSRVLAQYQAGGVTQDTGDARNILILGEKAKMRLHLMTRPDMKLTLHLERSLHDTHWGYHFAECRFFPITGEYRVDEMEPLVTVFIDATKGRPAMPRVTKTRERITLTLPGRRKIAFEYRRGRWMLM